MNPVYMSINYYAKAAPPSKAVCPVTKNLVPLHTISKKSPTVSNAFANVIVV